MAADGTPVQLDLRKKSEYAKREEFVRHAGYSLFINPVKNIRLICREFPWTIEIKGEWVTCGLVWKKLHEALWMRITDGEWVLIAGDRGRKRTVMRAMAKRLEERPDDDPVPLRIDYLGDTTIFKGLEKDAAYAEEVLMPGRETCETWAIRLGRR